MNTSTERALLLYLRTMKVMFALSAGLVVSLNVSRMGSVCDHSNVGRLYILCPVIKPSRQYLVSNSHRPVSSMKMI